MLTFEYEYTDAFAGEANYCWVERGTVTMPQLTSYGYDGTHGYTRANKTMERELVRKVKARVGLTGVRCERESWGDTIVLKPHGCATILFINFVEHTL